MFLVLSSLQKYKNVNLLGVAMEKTVFSKTIVINTLFTKLQREEFHLKSILTIIRYFYQKVKFQNFQIEKWFYKAIFNKYLTNHNDEKIINGSLQIGAILLSINCQQCIQVCDPNLLIVELNDWLSSDNQEIRQNHYEIFLIILQIIFFKTVIFSLRIKSKF